MEESGGELGEWILKIGEKLAGMLAMDFLGWIGGI